MRFTIYKVKVLLRRYTRTTHTYTRARTHFLLVFWCEIFFRMHCRSFPGGVFQQHWYQPLQPPTVIHIINCFIDRASGVINYYYYKSSTVLPFDIIARPKKRWAELFMHTKIAETTQFFAKTTSNSEKPEKSRKVRLSSQHPPRKASLLYRHILQLTGKVCYGHLVPSLQKAPHSFRGIKGGAERTSGQEFLWMSNGKPKQRKNIFFVRPLFSQFSNEYLVRLHGAHKHLLFTHTHIHINT